MYARVGPMKRPCNCYSGITWMPRKRKEYATPGQGAAALECEIHIASAYYNAGFVTRIQIATLQCMYTQF